MQGAARFASVLAALCCAVTARAEEPPSAPRPAERGEVGSQRLPGEGAAEAPAPVIAPELSLDWQAPVGCPAKKDVEAQFARLLGGPARVPSGKHIDATAAVRAPSTDRWALELSTVLEGGAGRRNLAGDSCASVASAAALILALMIDPAAAERIGEASAPPPPPTAPSPPPTVTAPVAAPPVTGPRVEFVARAFGGGVFGLLPEPAPAAGLALGARRGRFGAEVTGLATLQSRADSSIVADAGADLRLVAAGARACAALGGSAVVWQLCLGGELEQVSGTGSGSGVMPPRSQTVRMLAGTGGLLVTIPVGAHVALSLDLDAAVRAYHPAFVLDRPFDTTRLFQIPIASGFAAAGIIINL